MKSSFMSVMNAKNVLLVLAAMLWVNSAWAQHVSPNDNLYWLRYRTTTNNYYLALLPVDYNKQNDYAKSRNFDVITQTTQHYTKRGRAKKVRQYRRFKFDTAGRVCEVAGGKLDRPISWANTYSYNDKGYMYQVVSKDKAGKITSVSQHDYFTEGEKRFHYFIINKRGDTTIQTVQGFRDTITHSSVDYFYKKKRVKYSWANEYYANGSNKQTTLYNRKGKKQYVWNFECKDDGVEVAKHKDTTTFCSSREYDKDSILTEVHLSVDEKGNKYKEIYKKNRLGNTLHYIKTNEKNGALMNDNTWVYAADGSMKLNTVYKSYEHEQLDKEWITVLDSEGNITAKTIKDYKKGVLTSSTQETYEYDKLNRPILKKVLLAGGQPKQITAFSYN